MKICQVVAGDISQLGGLEKHVVDLCNHFSKNHDVTVVGHRNLRQHLSPDVMLVDLDLSKNRYHPGNILRLYRLLKGGGFDLVHAHANKAVFIASLLKAILRFNFVATLHGQKHNLKSYHKADHVIAVSHFISQGLRKDSCSVIYNGVHSDSTSDVDISLIDLAGVQPGDFIFCAIGRLVEVKGFDILLKAMSGVDAKLLIVGDGPDRNKLEQLTDALMIRDRVIFTGHLQQVQALIRKVDAVVISSHREGFPYVFTETLLNKTPVLATDVSDIKRILSDKYIVPVGDVAGLHEKMVYMKDHREEVIKDFTECYHFADRNLRFESMIEKTLDVYQSFQSQASSTKL